MSIRIKKKSRLYKLVEEPKLIDLILFGYLGGQCLNILLLDKITHYCLIGRIRYHLNQILKSFTCIYSSYLQLYSVQFYKFLPIITIKKQRRLTLPIYFSAKKLKKQFKYCISYSYEINRKNKNKQYAWSSQFYISDKKNRTLWAYKQNHNYAELPCYLMDVMQARCDDKLCIVLPFYSSGKPLTNLKFYPLSASEVGQLECPLQKMYMWTSQPKKPQKQIDFQVQDLIKGRPQDFQTKSIQYSPFENYYRIQLQCIKTFKPTKTIDLIIKGVSVNSQIEINLKKKGAYCDELNKLEIRVGDILIIYLIKS